MKRFFLDAISGILIGAIIAFSLVDGLVWTFSHPITWIALVIGILMELVSVTTGYKKRKK